MTAMTETIFVTGATGLIGAGALQQLLAIGPHVSAVVLVRDVNRWARHAARFGASAHRITPVKGDITSPGLGMDTRTRWHIAKKVTRIVHAAADTSFSRALDESRAANTLEERAAGRTVHLCSGKGAATLGALLDTAYDVWEREASWKKRRLARAVLTDLETYGMFERAVMDTGNPRLRGLISSLSHFVPQMALPKVFFTTATDELLDFVPPPTGFYWEPMLVNLIASGWSVTGETEEVAA